MLSLTKTDFVRYLFFFMILFIVFGCQKDDKDYNQRTSYFLNSDNSYQGDSILTCVTFNIQLGFKAGKDPWNKDQSGADENQVKAIAKILKQVDPDIVALQEVPRNRSNAVVKDFLEALAKETKMNFAFGSHGYNDPYDIYPVDGEWGNAILTKFEILEIDNHQVEYIDKWERRSVLNTLLRINDSTEIYALSLHFLPSEQGIPNTAGYIKKLDKPIILMGDYNYTGNISEFEKLGLNDVDSTFLNHGIDRFFVSEYFEVLETGTLPDSNQTSDHPANFCVLKF